MEQTTPDINPKSSNKFWMWLLVIAIPVGILAYIAMNRESKEVSPEPVAIKSEEQTIPSTPSEITPSETPDVTTGQTYKDGTYTAVGEYMSPGGPEQIGLSLTVKNNVITDATFTPKAERPMSVRFQDMFAAGYKEFVVGKKLDEVNLTKVSGSSLTPKGFNDALAKIKAEATS